ncbi:MAG: hypothetical protein KC492_42645 [Myxococcales bacterium]|nr:hypothetical protein [Myxococcales bacterium]
MKTSLRVGAKLGVLFMALVACKESKDTPPAPATPPVPAAVDTSTTQANPAATPQAAATQAAPSPQPAAAQPTAQPVVRPPIADGSVQAGRLAEGSPWHDTFKYAYPSGAPQGATWADARRACQGSGMDLCTEDQWALACRADSSIGNAQSWTVSYSTGTSWVVRGGEGCAAKSSDAETSKAPARIGLCCDRRAGVSGARTDALSKTASVYIKLVEDALNSGSADSVSRLLADDVLLMKTRTTADKAKAFLASDLQRWPTMNRRLTSCTAEIAATSGSFECDVVMTRIPAGTSGEELSVFRAKYAYGPPGNKYNVFEEPVRVIRAWPTK